MNDLTELERRVSAALDRIATHVDQLERRAPAPEPVAEPDSDLPAASELMADLEAERAVTAQLEERVRAIKEKQDNQIGILQSDLSLARDRIAQLEEENTALRDDATAAAATAQSAVGADDEKTSALQAELESLRAERESERAELAALLEELKPIVEESASA